MSLSSLGSVRWAAIVLLAVTFVAGGFAGAAWERSRGPHSDRAIARTRDGGPGGGPASRDGGRRRGPWFAESLGLTAAQQATIDSIMRVNRPRTDSLFASVMPRVRAISDSTRAAIDAVLTPEQREKLARMPRPEMRRRGPGGMSGGGSSRDSGRRFGDSASR